MGQDERPQSGSQAPSGNDGTGMLGAPGTTPKEDVPQTGNTAPVGVPTESGGVSPGSVAVPWANSTGDVPTHGDEAAKRLRRSGGAQNKPLPPGPDTPVPDAPQYDANTPTWEAGTRSTPENPIPEQPAPGLMDRPGPEAET